MQKICFFIGHRETPNEIMPVLCEAVEKHISDYHVTEFIVGHYGRFDQMAREAVINAKRLHPEAKLTLLLPYHPAERQVTAPAGFDGLFYPPGLENTPKRFRIIKANQYMLHYADYLIAYVRHPASNARNLIEYAEKKKDNPIIITKL